MANKGIQFKFEGFDKFIKKMKRGSKDTDGVINKVMKKHFALMKATAKQKCPVDTGALKSSIFYKKTRNMHYTLGASMSYAKFQEYGSQRQKKGVYLGSGRHGQPFLRPAVGKHYSAMNKEIAKSIVNI